ncbi:MAG: hypothetical protein HRT99_03680 [Mycoplasmatales bacterium]|nr:hypothetical protein [Mycoplasmatales bacterium]
MEKNKKLTIYDVNPRFFKDSTGNGIGDLKGLISKFDYLTFLGIDTLIIQGLISIDSKDKPGSFMKISKEIGGFKDLQELITKANKFGIKVFIEMKIDSIKENNEWFGKAVKDSKTNAENIIDFSSNKDKFDPNVKFNKEANAYFSFDEKTEEIPLNWNSKATHRKFVDVVRFWYKVGIDGFVFTDFEYINNPSKTMQMHADTLIELRKLYISIKEINDSIVVIGKSSKIDLKETNQYTNGSKKVFDYFKSPKVSLLGTHQKYGADVKGKFSPTKLFKAMKILANNPSNIIQFGSEMIGRFISRWGDSGQYISESAKAFAILLMLNPASKNIYYSDELGAKNIGLSHLDDFQDDGLSFRKDELFAQKVSNKKIMDAQVEQNPINARSLMAWNDSKNGGFSDSERTITPVSSGYRNDNVGIQFKDSNSILNFYKKLIWLTNKTPLKEVIMNGSWKISYTLSLPGAAKIVSKLGNKEVTSYINLTDSVRSILGVKKEGKIILSTYPNKSYSEIPNKLDAYEAIIITKNVHEEDGIGTIDLETEKLAKKEPKIEKAQNIKEVPLTTKKIAEKEIKNEVVPEKVESAKDKLAREEAQRLADQERKIIEEKELQVKMIAKEKEIKVPASEKNVNKSSQSELNEFKDKIKMEKETAKNLKSTNENSIMKEKVTSADHTKLTEDDIASTTQIDIDEIDDLEEFLNKSK